MDLLATVRKEGSRGGRGEFKWSDVQGSSHREHYLGHSVMAPVGRWQKGRDLNWYAKADDTGPDGEDAETKAARERKEEIQRVKEAEQDAMARVLGLPVPDRNNANLEQVNNKREFDKAISETIGDQGPRTSRGIGYGSGGSGAQSQAAASERIEGNVDSKDKELEYALREYKRRHRHRDRRHRSRSRSRSRSRDGLKESHRNDRERRDRPRPRHHRHRDDNDDSRDHHRRRRSGSRSRSRDRNERMERRDRSASPYRRGERQSDRSRRYDR